MKDGYLNRTDYLKITLKRNFELAPNDITYTESIIYYNEFDLWQMMLSMYLLKYENGELNEGLDTVLSYIKGLIITRQLDSAISNWSSTICYLNAKYRNRFDEFMALFEKYIMDLAHGNNCDTAYHNFLNKLSDKFYSFGYKKRCRVRTIINEILRKRD